MKHLMLDLETFSTRSDAAVFEVALVPFTKTGVDGAVHHWRFRPGTGHFCPDTIEWWIEQSPSPELFFHRPEAVAVQEIYNVLKDYSGLAARLWAKPASFDCIVLGNLLQRNGLVLPISPKHWRDVGTVLELSGHTPLVPRHTPHMALNDCRNQIVELTEAWKRLSPTQGAF